MSQKSRQTEIDVLRFLSIIAVIYIHVCSNGMFKGYLNSGFHDVCFSLAICCVPAFFMISGRFFLDSDRDVSVNLLFKKKIFHLVTVFLVWSGIYTCYHILTGDYDNLNIFGIISQYITGPYHFWFLFSLIGLYILTPFLRLITQNEEILKYFIVLFFVLNIIESYIIYIPKAGVIVKDFVDRFSIDMVVGYVGYYMLGYFIYYNRDRISEKTEKNLYILGISMFVLTCSFQIYVDKKGIQLPNAHFIQQYNKINVILYSVALYAFFLKRVAKVQFKERTKRLFAKLTELGLGVYIVHALITDLLSRILISNNTSIKYFYLVVYILLTYLLSLILTYVIRKIPLFGKKII
ncbi:MAG: acyltransferase [Lachnospiraceae bacterium]|nr:acyltransferase [Lachnospiraceae bacterium]